MDFEQFVIAKLNEIQEDQKKTLIQTTKTNGRVLALEQKVETHDETIQELFEKQSIRKGQDAVIWKVLVGIGSVGLIILSVALAEALKK